MPKAGGFTITSPPSKARPSPAAMTAAEGEGEPPAVPGYLELAVQKSPSNPPAAWLWREKDEGLEKPPGPPNATKSKGVLGRGLQVRVGGSFVWPPPGINVRSLRRAVFVAGGVGINPLIAMASSLVPPLPFEVKFLYSVKDPLAPSLDAESGPPSGESKKKKRDASKLLFLDRLVKIFGEGDGKIKGELRLFLTGGGVQEEQKGAIEVGESSKVEFLGRRMEIRDIEEAVGGPAERRFAVVYVCGVPDMTDSFVGKLRSQDGLGMEPHRVLCEKWW